VPQIGYFCPDGQSIKFEDCLKKCRMGERCLSLPTLKKMSEQRTWTGIPSTTQLIKGTKQAMLEILRNYYVKPKSSAFALLGTKYHKTLEDHSFIMEKEFKNKRMTGVADYYDPDEETLWDFKTTGSYKIRKSLGLTARKIKDPSGERYKRSGKGYKAGDVKMINEWYVNPKAKDSRDWDLQLNRYAVWFEEAEFSVKKIKIEATVRDGGLKAAITNGIEESMYVVELQKLDKEYVMHYFDLKTKALRSALTISWSPKCNEKETWGGIRCERFCPVKEFCDQMKEKEKYYNLFKDSIIM